MKFQTLFGKFVFSITAFAALSRAAEAADNGRYWVYVGTYTGPKSKGVYVFPFDTTTGKPGPITLAGECESPSFLALNPTGDRLYAANEGKAAGGLTAFQINTTDGTLKLLNQHPSEGKDPCHVSVDRDGKFLMAANYTSGSFVVVGLEANGSLGKTIQLIQDEGKGTNPQRQEGPHAHSINLDPFSDRVYGCDLGLDKIYIFKLGKDGRLSGNQPFFGSVKPGSGPRHMAFQSNGAYAYVINEMASTITTFKYSKNDGSLTEVASVSTLPDNFSGNNTTAEIAIHPTGRFVYGSNRGHNSIAIFSVDQSSGHLTMVGTQPSGGKTPRNFTIDPTGRYLIAANQDSDNVVFFAIDDKTGKLTPTGDTLSVGGPVCLTFLKR